MINKVLLASIALLPLALISPGPAFYSQRVAFLFVIWLVLAGLIENTWLRLFIIYITAWQVYLTVGVMYDKVEYKQYLMGLSMCNRIMWGLLIFWIVTKSTLSFNAAANVICVAAIIQALICIWQMKTSSRIMGSLCLENAITAWLAVTLPFFFRKYWILAIPLIFFILFKMPSQIMGLLAAGVGVMVFASPWLILASVPSIAGIIYWLTLNPEIAHILGGSRLNNWLLVWDKITLSYKSVLFGLGTGRDVPHYPIHNEFLGVWFMWGIVGLVLVVGFLITLPKHNRILVASLAALMAHSLTFYCLRIPPIGYLSMILFGLMAKERHAL